MQNSRTRRECNDLIKNDAIARITMMDLCSTEGYEDQSWYYTDDDGGDDTRRRRAEDSVMGGSGASGDFTSGDMNVNTPTAREPIPVLSAEALANAKEIQRRLESFCEHCEFNSIEDELVARRMQLENCRTIAGSAVKAGTGKSDAVNDVDACAEQTDKIEALNEEKAAALLAGNDLDMIVGGKDGFDKVGLLRLDLFFEHLNVETYTTSPKTSLSGVLSQLGGNFGLLLGFSIATMLEFIEFFLVHIFRRKQKDI
jgi:hypothetical protein